MIDASVLTTSVSMNRVRPAAISADRATGPVSLPKRRTMSAAIEFAPCSTIEGRMK